MADRSPADQELSRRTSRAFAAAFGSGRGPGKSATAVTNRRLFYSMVIVGIVAILLFSRLFYLQVLAAPQLEKTATELRTQTYALEAKRGDILDRNGAILATSVERYNVRVDQAEIAEYRRYNDADDLIATGAAAAAQQLAEPLGMDEAELGGMLLGGEEKNRWSLVARDLSPEEWREINALGIRGIYPERYMQREYPNGYVAGNILGYTGVTAEDDTVAGRAGIEQSFESVLAGEPGTLTVEVGPAGTIYPQGDRSETPAVDGGNVQLTIDRDIQMVTQESLDAIVADTGAEWATAVVIEIGTGRILALGDSSAPDPSNLDEVDPSDWNSRAVQAVVEPGSTGKIITLSALLDQGVVSPLDEFYTPDEVTTPNGETIKDDSNHEAAWMTAAGIIAKSYNTGLVQMGDLLTPEARFDYMLKFGLGKATGIELPGEASGLITDVDMWDKRTQYTTMFGQGWAATTLQLGQMISIIGNDGVKIPLHIVEGSYDSEGTFTESVIGASEQIISPDAAAVVNEMLQAVTQKGASGVMAGVPGYNVAGKTGTAQIPGPTGELTNRVGTFTGLIPAEEPQVAVAVVVYNPPAPGYGGTTAAPVFSEIAEFTMRKLGVAPSTEDLVKFPWYRDEVQ